MTGPIHIYYVWYGSEWRSSDQQIFIDFANTAGSTAWFSVLSTWPDGNGNTISGPVSYAGSTTDNLSQGTTLDAGAVQTIVNNALSSQALPTDPSGLYVVVGAGNVSEPTCGCLGFHGSFGAGNTEIRYSWISQSPISQPNSPNGNSAIDLSVETLSHELAEAATDPEPGEGWTNGGEIGDICVGQTAPLYRTANGSLANTPAGTRDFILQDVWLNQGAGSCAGAYWTDEGQACSTGADCPSTHVCGATGCSAPTCTDGVQNGYELGIDCGHDCEPCYCRDGVRDGDESDVDCGGSCSSCNSGQACNTPLDCLSGVCVANVCTTTRVTIAVNPAGGWSASGQMAAARASSTRPEEIVCQVTGSGGSCSARDSTGQLVSCQFSASALIQAANTLTENAVIAFTADDFNQCTSLTTITSSAFAPVAP